PQPATANTTAPVNRQARRSIPPSWPSGRPTKDGPSTSGSPADECGVRRGITIRGQVGPGLGESDHASDLRAQVVEVVAPGGDIGDHPVKINEAPLASG